MHLHTILAFIAVFWDAERGNERLMFDRSDILGTCLWVFLQPVLLGLASFWVSARTRRQARERFDEPDAAQRFHHRATFLLRLLLLGGFASSVLATPWPDWFEIAHIHPALQIFGDLAVLCPYFLGAIVLWIGAYPLERAIRTEAADWLAHTAPESASHWTLRRYLDFNARHHLLVVAVPMLLILFAANLTRHYETVLVRTLNWTPAPDVLLGLFAAGVFVIAPSMLRRIWRTRPLAPGALRERLEALCRRIGFRCRDILVWETDGFMINAAVMGVVGRFRYVLLSDALLATMTPRQIEAVFGHEAGHVHHRHMQKFLGVAFVGWLLVAALMEVLARWSLSGDGPVTLSADAIQGVGAVGTALFWGVGFGMISRRFERQADVFGVRCVTPEPNACEGPCSLHTDEGAVGGDSDTRLCSTGAALFASALDRVASLNGIPREERSWRHSSIASRMRFLATLAGDPRAARQFERTLERLSAAIATLCLLGGTAFLAYWFSVSEPAILTLGGSGL